MNINKANRRDKQRGKKKNGMQEDGRSVKLLEEIKRNKGEKARKKVE